MRQRTLCLIKPDAVSRNLVGAVLQAIEAEGLHVCALRMLHFTKAQAQGFYAVHRERPFFDSLATYMCSGPLVAVVLGGENAVARYRTLMGATNPADAAEGTLRQRFAQSLEHNTVHGSDSLESAATEIAYLFSVSDIVSR